jgi:hypothetical protein
LLVAWVAVESFTHHVCTLLIIISTTETVRLAWWYNRGAIQWDMLVQSVPDVLLRCRSDGFRVGGLQRSDGCVLGVSVTGERGGVVRTLMVVRASADSRIEAVDDIRTLHGTLLEVVWLRGFPRVPSDNVQRLVAFITGVTLGETAGTATVAATAAACYGIICGRRVLAGPASTVGARSKCCFAVLGEFGRRAAASRRAVADMRASTGVTRRCRLTTDWVDRGGGTGLGLGRTAVWVAGSAGVRGGRSCLGLGHASKGAAKVSARTGLVCWFRLGERVDQLGSRLEEM